MENKDSEVLNLILRAFTVFNGFDGPCGTLDWRTDNEYKPVALFVNCNDLFYWASADGEDLTLSNIQLLEDTYEELKAKNFGPFADILFCCRSRKMRPQKPYYNSIPKEIHDLFDLCGPERSE